MMVAVIFVLEYAAAACQLLPEGILREYHELSQKMKFVSQKYSSVGHTKLIRYSYDGRNSLEGVLEHLVNRFLEAIGGGPAHRLIYVISCNIRLW